MSSYAQYSASLANESLTCEIHLTTTVNLWGFERVTSNGPEKGAYYHKHFLKGKHSLVKLLTRQRGNKSADSSVHSSPKPTKQKNPKIKRTTAAKHLEHPTFSTKVECLKGKNLKTDSEVIKIETGTTQYEERLSVSSPRSIDKAFTQQETSIIPDRKLFFEGCEFFPLEEERYDELEEVILEASADLLNWPRLQNDPEPSISASRPPTFGLPPPPSQLCRV